MPDWLWPLAAAGVGAAAGIAVAWGALRQARRTAQVEMTHTFEALAARALHTVQADQKEQLGGLVEPLAACLQGLEGHVRDLESKREGAYQGLEKHLQQLADSHRFLQSSTDRLGQALHSSSVRGRWGELQLRRVAELAGMEKHVDFDEQAAGDAGRPDMVVRLPQGAVLPVDSKAPMAAYFRAVEAVDEDSRKAFLKEHADAMRARVRELGAKRYWEQFERAPDFVVMFVPSEASLGAAFQSDPELFESALRQHVVVASPFTLYALLRASAAGWQQQQIAENARLLSAQGKELYERLTGFLRHLQTAGKALRATVQAHNDAVGSLEARLLPSAEKFRGLAAIEDRLPSIETQDVDPRRCPGVTDWEGRSGRRRRTGPRPPP